MKYTNYILNGRPLQPENLISEGRFRVLSIVAVMVPSLVGVVVISGMIPVAWFMDGGRYLKLRHYQRLKAQRKKRYYKSVMVSLGHNENEWILLAA
jgi:uncharacterized membrane protein YciS (DUF1049 family)